MKNLFHQMRAIAAAVPCTRPEDFNRPIYHHGHPQWPGWRIAIVLDATPNNVDGCPCWHATVIYGEQLGGRLQPAKPMGLWDRNTRRMAPKLLKHAIDGVGTRESRVIADIAVAIAFNIENGLPPAVGLSARVKLHDLETFSFLTGEERRFCGGLMPEIHNPLDPDEDLSALGGMGGLPAGMTLRQLQDMKKEFNKAEVQESCAKGLPRVDGYHSKGIMCGGAECGEVGNA